MLGRTDLKKITEPAWHVLKGEGLPLLTPATQARLVKLTVFFNSSFLCVRFDIMLGKTYVFDMTSALVMHLEVLSSLLRLSFFVNRDF